MEGETYRKERERVEGLYVKIDAFIANGSIKEAEPQLKKTEKILVELSKKISGEIQERSLLNLRIKRDYLVDRIEELKAKKK